MLLAIIMCEIASQFTHSHPCLIQWKKNRPVTLGWRETQVSVQVLGQSRIFYFHKLSLLLVWISILITYYHQSPKPNVYYWHVQRITWKGTLFEKSIAFVCSCIASLCAMIAWQMHYSISIENFSEQIAQSGGLKVGRRGVGDEGKKEITRELLVSGLGCKLNVCLNNCNNSGLKYHWWVF